MSQLLVPKDLKQVFLDCCESSEIPILHTPGSAGLSVIFDAVESGVDCQDIARVMALEQWPDTHSFDWATFLNYIMQRL